MAVYDPGMEFVDAVQIDSPTGVERDLSADEWGIHGEGPPRLWDAFTATLNSGRLDGVPVDMTPDAPDWGEARMGFARSAQKPRGKTLYAHVGMTPESMAMVQGTIGGRSYDTDPETFLGDHRADDVEQYAERFEAGDRPGPFVVEIEQDGSLSSFQEGRHRSLAAIRAGIETVPAIVLWDTTGTNIRRERRRGPDTPGYRRDYPEDT